MDKSLINPNQFIHYGIPVCDDPADKYRYIGLAVDDNLFILMYIDGTTCGFDSSCPNLDEMTSCKWIKASHEADWDPLTVNFNVSLMEKENRYAVHAVSKFEDFSNYSICDIVFEHQSTTAKRFTNAVNITPVKIDRIAAVFGSNYRHHFSTAENISMKWGCSITSAKNMLINMMQDNIRSAVMPLTRQYRTEMHFDRAAEQMGPHNDFQCAIR